MRFTIVAWAVRELSGDAFQGAVRLNDAPAKVVVTDRAVYSITGQSRYVRAWGQGFFGLNASTVEGTRIAEPTNLVWKDKNGARHDMDDAPVVDISAPDDGSFVVALVGFNNPNTYQFLSYIYTWGINDKRQLGRTTTNTFDDIPGLVNYFTAGVPEPAVSVHAGADFVIVLQPNGRLWGWGSNAWGQVRLKPVFFVDRLHDSGLTPYCTNLASTKLNDYSICIGSNSNLRSYPIHSSGCGQVSRGRDSKRPHLHMG